MCTASSITTVPLTSTVVRGLAALKIFPLRAGDSTVGTLVCGSNQPDALPEPAQKELSMLALQAAEAVVRTRLYEQAERLATTDGLTGLVNRRTFNAQLAARIRTVVESHPEVRRMLDVELSDRRNKIHAHVVAEVAGEISLEHAHQIESQLEEMIRREIPETHEVVTRVTA